MKFNFRALGQKCNYAKVWGQNCNFQKVGWWIILINVDFKRVKFAIIDQERREEYIKRGKEKIVE